MAGDVLLTRVTRLVANEMANYRLPIVKPGQKVHRLLVSPFSGRVCRSYQRPVALLLGYG